MANSATILHKIVTPFSSVTDLNNCDHLGLYMYDPNTANTTTQYGLCLTLATEEPKHTTRGWVIQLALGIGDRISLYFRKRINNGNWTEWKRFSPITNLTDANDISNIGIINVSKGVSNTPWASNSEEFVGIITFPITSGTQIIGAIQLCTCFSRNNANFQKIYKRRSDGSWTEWVAISS